MFKPGTIMLIKNTETGENLIGEFVSETKGKVLCEKTGVSETLLEVNCLPQKEVKVFSDTKFIWADALAVIKGYEETLDEIERIVKPTVE